MATRNLVPRANNEGKIGTSSKKWNEANFTTGNFTNLTIGGDLTISGSTTTIDTEIITSDRFILMNSEKSGSIASEGGIVILNSTDSVATSACTAFTSSSRIITVSDSSNFAVNDIVVVQGSSSNDGLYHVTSKPSGTQLEIASSALTAIDGIILTSLVDETGASANVRKATISVLRSKNSNVWEYARGNTKDLSYKSLNNSFSTVAVSGQSNVVADDTNDTLTLVAGSNVTLTTNASNDSITIAASGGGGGSSTLSGLSDTAINSPSAGHIIIWDGSDSFDNYSISGDITMSSGGVTSIGTNRITQSMLQDDIVGQDELAANAVTNAAILNGTIKADKLDIDGSTDIGAALVDDDLIIVDDGANGTNRKATLSRLKTYMNIPSQRTEEEIEDFVGGMVTGNTETFITVTYQDADGTLDFEVPVHDEDNMSSNSASHLATQQSIKAYVDAQVAGAAGDIEGVTAGDGLSGGGTTGTVSLALDLNELTAAAVDVGNDSLAIIDASDSNTSRKESIVDLVAGIAGTGLTASSGQLSVTGGTTNEATNVTVTANNSTDETVYPTFVDGATGAQGIETDTGLTYNPSTGILTTEVLSAKSDLRLEHSGTTKTITVTVAAKSAAHRYNGSGSSSGYKLDGVESPFLLLSPGRTYKFDQSDSSNSGHPLRFYLDANKVTAYTTGVTTGSTPGSSGAYTQIVVSDTTPQVLHYQCSAHSLMGNALQSNSVASKEYTTGLKYTDSPQFTGLELGHVSDTTITRASAGDINIEGNIIYRAGGTDVPVTDGGTGASSAADARTNLGLGDASTLAVGISENNVLQANANVADNDFLRVDGTKVEGLTAAEVLTALNVESGADVTDATNVQAAGALMDSEVTSLSGIKSLTVPDNTTISAYGASLIDDADASAARTTLALGNVATLAVGISNTNVLQANSNVADNDFLRVDGTSIEGRTASEVLSDIGAQANDAGLTSIAGLTTTADKMIYTTGADTYTVTSLTAAGRAILDDADAAAQRVTLGVGASDSPTFAGGTLGNVQVGLTGDNEIDTASGNLTIDSAGGTVTIDDNLTVSGNASIVGNLTVTGTTTTLNSEIALADRFMLLNSNYTTDASVDGGIVVNVDPSGAVYDGSSININFNSTTTVQIAGDASTELAANKIFMIRNAEDAANNGLYQVHSSSHNSGTTTVTIKDASSNQPSSAVSGIVNTSFTTNADDDSAVIARTKIAVLKSDTANNVFEVGFGDDGSSLSYTDLATSGGGITGLSTNASDTLTIGTSYNLIPNSAGTSDLGTASAEFGNIFIADDKKLQFGSDQDVTIEYDEDGDDVLQIAGGDVRIGHGAASQLQFRDSEVYINSDADGYLNARADTGITFNVNGTDELALTGSTATFGTNIVVPDAATIGSASDTDAIAISSAGVVAFSATTEASATGTAAVTIAGGLGVAKDMWLGDDLVLDSDSAMIKLGADQDVTLTHVADTGLLLNGTMQLQFNDASQYINAPSATVLDINATDEVEINATLLDVNANLDVSGTYTGAGLMTTGGNIVIPDAGTIGSASDTDAIAISSAGVITLSATTEASAIGTAALVVAGGASVAKDLYVGDDLELDSDGAKIGFGADSDVSLTHVADTGLLLNTSRKLQFGDSGTFIHQSSDGVLTIESDTTVDINGAVTMDGALTGLTSINVAGTITGDTSLTLDSTTITTAEIGVLDGVTAGTAAASKALVLDANKDIGTIRNLTIDGTFSDGNYTFDTSGNVSGLGTVSCGAITSTGTSTFAGGVTPASSDGAALGSALAEWSDLYLALGGQILFGDNQKVTITHELNKGLILKNGNVGDDNPFVLTLQTGETDIAANDVIGKIDFQAPDEVTGTDAILVCAGIEAVSEGDFSATSNATKLSFKTGASEAASEKMSLSSAGNLTVSGSSTFNAGISVKNGATSAGFIELFEDSDNGTNKVKIQAPALSGDYTLTLPVDDGTDGQVLKTNGSGVLAWVDQSGGGSTAADDIGQGDSAVDIITTLGDITLNANHASGNILFKSNNTEFLKIDSGGNVKFGAGAGSTGVTITSQGQITADGRLIIDNTTNATSTTNGSLQTDGGLSVAKDIVLGDDLYLKSDASVIHFGADSEITLTHVHNEGLLLEAGTVSGAPILELKNANSDANAATIKLNKNGTSVADNDIIGNIDFISEDDADNVHTYARIQGQIADMTSTSEGGNLLFQVAENDGTLTNGLQLKGYNADGVISAFIGAGNASNVIYGEVQVTGNSYGIRIDNGKELRLFEESGNGSNYVAIKSPSSVASNLTFTLPGSDGTNGQVLQTNGSGVLSFVDQSGGGGSQLPPEVKTVSTTATLSLTPSNSSTYNSIEVIYTCTGSSAYTVTLPTAASIEGKKINVKSLATANITVDGDGSETIDGSANFVLSTQYEAITLVSDGTNWIII